MNLNILVDKELKPFPICCLSTITRLHRACQSLCKVIFKQVQPNVNKKEFLVSWHPSKKIKNIQLIKHSDIFQKYFCSPTIPKPLAKQVSQSQLLCILSTWRNSPKFSPILKTTHNFPVFCPSFQLFNIYTKLDISGYLKICFLCFINFPYSLPERECTHLRGREGGEEREEGRKRDQENT